MPSKKQEMLKLASAQDGDVKNVQCLITSAVHSPSPSTSDRKGMSPLTEAVKMKLKHYSGVIRDRRIDSAKQLKALMLKTRKSPYFTKMFPNSQYMFALYAINYVT